MDRENWINHVREDADWTMMALTIDHEDEDMGSSMRGTNQNDYVGEGKDYMNHGSWIASIMR